MMVQQRSSQSGFTLVEMLVALAIFSLISVAGVALLQSASNTQLAVKDRLGDLSANARAVAMIEADLAQAAARPVRLTATGDAAAFVSGGSETTGQLFAFTSLGRSNLDDAPRSDLQRVAYALEDGELRRIGSTMADGGTAQPVTLLKDVTTAVARFRDAEGNWRSDWDASDPLLLPRAVELTVTQRNAAPLQLLFLVGAPGVPVQPVEWGKNADPA